MDGALVFVRSYFLFPLVQHINCGPHLLLTGWLAFRSPHRVHHHGRSEPTVQPRRAEGVLYATRTHDAHTDIPTNVCPRPTTIPSHHRSSHFSTAAAAAFSRVQKLVGVDERVLVLSARHQSFRRTSCGSGPAMDSESLARSPEVQRFFKERPYSTVSRPVTTRERVTGRSDREDCRQELV
jgi:hypothetical protein